MGRRKKSQTTTDSENEIIFSGTSEIDTEKSESIQEVETTSAEKPNARLPKMDKGIPAGKLTFDIFFAYCIKKYPESVKVSHYRAMKNYLKGQGYAMIDSKDGFCESFKSYGLIIE